MKETKVTVVFSCSFKEVITDSLNFLESYHYIELSDYSIEEYNESIKISLEWNYGKIDHRIMKKEVKSITEYYNFMIDVVKQQDKDIYNDYYRGEEAAIVRDSILGKVNRFEEVNQDQKGNYG